MIKPLMAIASVVLATMIVPGVSNATPRAPDGAPTVAKTRYCVIETPTGSHIRKKTCLTRDEWLRQGFDPLEK